MQESIRHSTNCLVEDSSVIVTCKGVAAVQHVNPKLAVGDDLGGKRLFDDILWRVLREHSFDEEPGHDMANNCRRLWPLIFGREIGPRAEIIAPALAIRNAGYGEPTRDYKQELRDALKS
jgi:hypothetical protein